MQNTFVTLIVNCILALITWRYGNNAPGMRSWRGETFLRGQHAAVLVAPWWGKRRVTIGVRVQLFALVGT